MRLIPHPKIPCPDCGKPMDERARHCRKCSGKYTAEKLRHPIGDPAERFWAKVDKSAGPSGCWPWAGGTSSKGYGRFKLHGKFIPATHFALALDGRPVPYGMRALHHCDNPPCCNPAHLFIGTDQDNMNDCKAKGRRPTSEQMRAAIKPMYGDDNPSRLHPERLKRGAEHPHRLHPENLAHLRGEGNPIAKLTWEQVREIRTRHENGESNRALGLAFGVSKTNIMFIVRGETWKE